MTAQDFSARLSEMLQQYSDDISAKAAEAAEQTAKETVRHIKSAAQFGGTGKYVRSLKIKNTAERRHGNFKFTVYSAAPYYRLTHLLENGHAIVKKGIKVGETRSFPHWAAGQDFVVRRFPELLERNIGG